MESATDYQITPGELQDLLVRTANQGDLGPEVTGHERWVNARAAALELLGIDADAPELAITSHEDGDEIVAEEFYALTARATDFLGRPLPVTWSSNVDGDLGTVPAGQNIGPDLSIGAHTLQAAATDFLGTTTRTDIEVVVVDNPPLLTIGAPVDGSQYVVGQSIPLTGLGVDPDTWIALTDQEVEWEIARSNGTVLGHWSGLVGQVETGVWGAGNYVLTFRTVDGAVSESVAVSVVVPPPGTPVVQIDEPIHGAEVYASPFDLSGSATVDGVAVSGTRFRWVATAGDTEVVLCTGSAFHGPQPGDEPGLATPTTPVDCSESEAALFYVSVGDNLATTVWTIRLEVRGPGGQIGSDEAAVTFVLMIP
jgi:serine protease